MCKTPSYKCHASRTYSHLTIKKHEETVKMLAKLKYLFRELSGRNKNIFLKVQTQGATREYMLIHFSVKTHYMSYVYAQHPYYFRVFKRLKLSVLGMLLAWF